MFQSLSILPHTYKTQSACSACMRKEGLDAAAGLKQAHLLMHDHGGAATGLP
jgi:hypothetical protein